MSAGRIEIGQPLSDFEGVLTGVPKFVGRGANVADGA
jgi:hypothetical protein